MASAAVHLRNRVVGVLGTELRQHGFRRSKSVFNRKLAPDITQVLAVTVATDHMVVPSPAAGLLVQYGVHTPDMWWLFQTEPRVVVAPMFCAVRVDLAPPEPLRADGYHAPPLWSLDEGADAQLESELVEAVVRRALPWLDVVDSRAGIARSLRESVAGVPPLEVLPACSRDALAAILEARQGRTEVARGLLLADAAARHPNQRDFTLDLAHRLGLDDDALRRIASSS